MKIVKGILILVILPLMLIWVGCSLEKPTETQSVLGLGNANFTSFVAIGNSITAGYQSGSLVETHQQYSFGNQIANQVEATFAQPTVSYPGIPAILELVLLDPPTLQAASGMGAPTNLTHPAPYNNLGIPGALLNDVLFATDANVNTAVVVGGRDPQPQFDLVLRGLGTQFQQARMLQATTLTLWIGNNDVLGFATSGGFSPTEPTDVATFSAIYTNMADSIASLGADVFVANIPDVTAIPFFTTVGPQMSAGIAAAGFDMYYQKHGEFAMGQPGSGSGVTTLSDPTSPLITLLGSSYVGLLGQPTGLWYRELAADLGFPVATLLGIYAGIDTTQAFGFHPQNPWPDALILDPDEIATAATHIAGYNSSIQTVATANGFHLVDVNTFFNEIAAEGYSVGGQEFSAGFITGGLFSLDGVHPSDIGHGVIANEFIKVMNSANNASIPLVNVISLAKPAANLSNAVYQNPNDLKNVIKMMGGFQF